MVTAKGVMTHSDNELIEAATAVRENAYAPFSEFRVGAALETDDELRRWVIHGVSNARSLAPE